MNRPHRTEAKGKGKRAARASEPDRSEREGQGLFVLSERREAGATLVLPLGRPRVFVSKCFAISLRSRPY